MSVFISIVSYCDPVLGFTMERALATARHPGGLHFGVVDQSEAAPPPRHRKPDHLSYVRLDPADARGPCWARALAMSFYAGEDWFLQIDSHMDFDMHWDERLIAQAKALLPQSRGVVLSTYPNAFVFEGDRVVRKGVTDKVLALVVKPGTQFAPDHAMLGFEGHPVDSDSAIPGFHVGAGALFAPGRFALEFPYDPALYFHGEEQSLAIRLYTHGWDIYHTSGFPIYHLYNTGESGTERRPLHWDKTQEAQRKVKWQQLEGRSRARLGQLTSGAPLGVYGLGRARTMADFAAYCGIDYARRTLAPQAYQPLPGSKNSGWRRDSIYRFPT